MWLFYYTTFQFLGASRRRGNELKTHPGALLASQAGCHTAAPPRIEPDYGLYGDQKRHGILKLACYTATSGLDCVQKKSSMSRTSA